MGRWWEWVGGGNGWVVGMGRWWEWVGGGNG